MGNNVDKITVLYYDHNDMTSICSDVLTDLDVGEDERVVFPSSYRDNKIIVAVLDGICNVRNALGDRSIFAKTAR
ncbi:DUF2375 family protein [Thalassotalea crassostreae]|uniref:DUF2375 family protein n=1 Tax=Thalassotalea crassostreae TaxID=1763536 RepID=UPI00083820D4|nr:DUF2375 family protein [Thalassotalea crassostreae]